MRNEVGLTGEVSVTISVFPYDRKLCGERCPFLTYTKKKCVLYPHNDLRFDRVTSFEWYAIRCEKCLEEFGE